jgi:hypothetical protein
MRNRSPFTGTFAILATVLIVVQPATPQSEQTIRALPERLTDRQKDNRLPITFRRVSHAGAAITSPNVGNQGTLDVLEGGGSSRIWSFDIESDVWTPLDNAPGTCRSGRCDFQSSQRLRFRFCRRMLNQLLLYRNDLRHAKEAGQHSRTSGRGPL